jgi:cytochrome c biogenesis protein CcdA
MLPLIIGGSLGGQKQWWRPLIIITSLLLSVAVFTLLISLAFNSLGFSQQQLVPISGAILAIFGLFYIFPEIWDTLSMKLNLSGRSDKLLAKSSKQGGWLEPLLIGLSLGPVFSSCSPTYAVLISVILPVNFWIGLVYLLAYLVGLGLVMLAISIFGQMIIKKLKFASDPNGMFKKVLGGLFVFLGIAIILGLDKEFETWLVQTDFFSQLGVTDLEQSLSEELRE